MLAKPLHIRRSADFSEVYDAHRSKACPYLVIYKKENDDDYRRLSAFIWTASAMMIVLSLSAVLQWI